MLMSGHEMKFCIRRSFADFGYELTLGVREVATGKWGVAKPIEVEPLQEGSNVPATMRLDDPELQQLMDELWRVGIRPSNGEGNVGMIGAMKEHLADMRKLVFSKQEGK